MASDTPPPSDKPNLSFVTTHELVEEIRVRSEAFLLIMEPKTESTADTTGGGITYGGGLTNAMGLAAAADAMLRRYLIAPRDADLGLEY